ncbi:MAG TPA: hypothetical protein PLO16_08585, partial [Acidocella sp.]|nr:hypothetical protein [Acidocella sp.]
MTNKFRYFLAATTSLWLFSGGVSFAQTASTTSSSTEIDLGSVSASNSSQGYVAPSSTGTRAQAVAKQKIAPNIVFVRPAS